MVLDKSFRQDLLYRINTIEINLPPLRQRLEDIPMLADHFLKIYAKKYNKPVHSISQPAIKRMMKYQWPGNVRELQHAIERAVIMSSQHILQAEDFFFHSKTTADDDSAAVTLEEYNLDDVEKILIRKVLQKFDGNITKAASELGLTRSSLYRRLEKYGL